MFDVSIMTLYYFFRKFWMTSRKICQRKSECKLITKFINTYMYMYVRTYTYMYMYRGAFRGGQGGAFAPLGKPLPPLEIHAVSVN